MQKLITILAAFGALLSGGFAGAETFPSRPIRLVVPYVAGGASDVVARTIAQNLGEELKQPVIVDNRPGAGGSVGSEIVAKASSDGYTLVLANVGTHAINPSLYASIPYDPVKDFAPIALVATGPTVLVVHPSLPIRTMADLLKYAREHPGRLNYASAGIGSTQHLAGELLKRKAGIDIVHVPYKGGGAAVADLLGGQVQMMFPNIPAVNAFIASGKLRAIAVASPRRWPQLPNVPTVAEGAGWDSFDVSTWFGILAPAGTPKEIITKLHDAIVKVLAQPEIRTRLAAEGVEPLTSTPEEFARYIHAEIPKWAAVVKASGARAD